MYCATVKAYFMVVKYLFDYGESTCSSENLYIRGGERDRTLRVIKRAKYRANEALQLVNDVRYGEKVFNLQEWEQFIFCSDVPLYAKLKVLWLLLEAKKSFSELIPDEQIKKYYHHIVFAYCFFRNDAVFHYAIDHNFFVIKDNNEIFYPHESTLEAAIQRCMPLDIIPKLFERVPGLYANRNLIALLKAHRICKRRRVVKKRQLQGPVKNQDECNLERLLIQTVKKAKRAQRRSFVKNFYRTYVACRVLQNHVPPEVAGYITGFGVSDESE